MANIEITENSIVRSLVRKGSDSDRLQVVLEEGELGYSTDKERLYAGDGITLGGKPVSVKFLGNQESFPNVASLNPEPGDYFKLGTGIYARNSDGSGNLNDVTGYTSIGISASVGNGLEIDSSSNINVLVDNNTIEIANNKLQVKNLSYNVLPSSSGNSIFGNATSSINTPTDIVVNENSLLARVGSADIGNVTFDQVLQNASNPTLSQLQIGGLQGTDTRPVFAQADGTLITQNSSSGNLPTTLLSFNQAGDILYNYNISSVELFNYTEFRSVFDPDVLGFASASNGNTGTNWNQYLTNINFPARQEQPFGGSIYTDGGTSPYTDGKGIYQDGDKTGVYKIVLNTPVDNVNNVLIDASSNNFIPVGYPYKKTEYANTFFCETYWESASIIWLLVGAYIGVEAHEETVAFIRNKLVHSGLIETRTQFSLKIYS